jgi:hypothetical protein
LSSSWQKSCWWDGDYFLACKTLCFEVIWLSLADQIEVILAKSLWWSIRSRSFGKKSSMISQYRGQILARRVVLFEVICWQKSCWSDWGHFADSRKRDQFWGFARKSLVLRSKFSVAKIIGSSSIWPKSLWTLQERVFVLRSKFFVGKDHQIELNFGPKV